MNDYITKIDRLFSIIKNIPNPNILELGVQSGRSTLKFLDLCNKNNGKLFSVDVDDCTSALMIKDGIYKSRDDNFEYIKSIIPDEIDVIFIDTLHEAKHVKKILLLL